MDSAFFYEFSQATMKSQKNNIGITVAHALVWVSF